MKNVELTEFTWVYEKWSFISHYYTYIYIYTCHYGIYYGYIYICHHYISHYGFTSAPKVRGQRVELSLVELALTSLRSGDLRLSESDRWGTVPRNGDRPHKVSLKYGEHIFYDGIMMGL